MPIKPVTTVQIKLPFSQPNLTACILHDNAMHSEAIWGVMIALVFLAIFEPHDENKS